MATKYSTTPGCKYNPEGVRCHPGEHHCESCGHNPAVAAARLQKLHPGYLGTLAPVRKELLSGTWVGTGNG